jgi:DNA-binding response OmpR family regulator
MASALHTLPASSHKESLGAARESGMLKTGDFQIDLDRHMVLVRGQRLNLSAEEFDLLVFLVMHQKRIVTSQTTLSTHWGEDRVRQARFLQVLLTLKKKLEALGAAHYIRTEPMVVYRFDPEG